MKQKSFEGTLARTESESLQLNLGHQLEANTCFSHMGLQQKKEYLSRRGQAPPKKTRCAKIISTTSPDLGEAEDPEQEDLAAR